jgi:hypothetical protein
MHACMQYPVFFISDQTLENRNRRRGPGRRRAQANGAGDSSPAGTVL